MKKYAITYYLLLPIIYLVAWSPSWILYGISDFLYLVLYRIVGYRKKVVYHNLKNAFPEKSEAERLEIEKKHFRFLADLLVESVKSIGMSERYVKKHLRFIGVEEMDVLYEKGQSFVLVMGHYGNWELAGPCFELSCKHHLNVVYKQLSNPYFEKMFHKARTKFGTDIIPMQHTLRVMASKKNKIDATALIADQTPSDVKSGHWLQFLSQETLVFTGPEKISKMFDYPVVYMHVQRVRRGYYEIRPTIITNNPKETKEHEITEAFFKRLEQDICQMPETWLWSHRRWKHKREMK